MVFLSLLRSGAGEPGANTGKQTFQRDLFDNSTGAKKTDRERQAAQSAAQTKTKISATQEAAQTASDRRRKARRKGWIAPRFLRRVISGPQT